MEPLLMMSFCILFALYWCESVTFANQVGRGFVADWGRNRVARDRNKLHVSSWKSSTGRAREIGTAKPVG